jgi:acyl carrier protein
MEIDDFVIKFEGCFDEIKPGTILPETQFRNLQEWDSLTALTLLAMVDADYDVAISANELRSCNKVHEVFDLIRLKKSL